MEAVRFDELQLDERIVRAVTDMGFEAASPIQAQAIPVQLEGLDIIGQAQTGTGKTAAFVVGRIRGMRTASILNVVAACKGNVAENIGRYVDGETLTAQGEEYEILTAFAALTRQ